MRTFLNPTPRLFPLSESTGIVGPVQGHDQEVRQTPGIGWTARLDDMTSQPSEYCPRFERMQQRLNCLHRPFGPFHLASQPMIPPLHSNFILLIQRIIFTSDGNHHDGGSLTPNESR
jgi:hypothetical protein